MLPSACSFIVFIFLKESALLLLLPLLHVVIVCSFSFVFFCCVFVSFLILVCVFAFLPVQQKQRSRFLQEYKSETSYMPEDGHVGRNM
jgi:hypothetical protein